MLNIIWHLDAPFVLLAIGILKVDYWLTRKVYGDNEISEEYLNTVVRLVTRK